MKRLLSLLMAVSILLSMYVGVVHASSVNEGEVAREFMLRALPQLSKFLGSEPNVTVIGKDPITSLLVVKAWWNESGLYAEVKEARIEGDWVPYALYVTVDRKTAGNISAFIDAHSEELIEALRNYHMKLVELAEEQGVKVIGFGVYINDTPLAFLLPGPYLQPVKIYWGVRFEGPIIALALSNDYVLIKPFLKSNLPKYVLSPGDASQRLSKQAGLRINESALMKYYVVFNGSLRPAYIAYINPYDIGVVLADDGSVKVPQQYTSVSKEVTSEGNWFVDNAWIISLGIALLVLIVGVLLWRLRLRSF